MRHGLLAMAATALTGLSAPASAACELARYAELPITMMGARPIVVAKIGGKDARFIVDSGAFYSTISQAAALEFGLKLTPAPAYFRIKGVNGDASVSTTTTRDFNLAGVTLPKVGFLVGGSDTGTAGLLGQDFLGIDDVEYDLPHGGVRLMRARNCELGSLAYWAGGRPVTAVPLQARQPPFQTHTIGTVTLNGVKLRALFDTGAPASMLTLDAAKRAGITPDSPGVETAGVSTGIGRKTTQAWLAPFGSIDIGGETIPHPKIYLADIELGDADMMIGVDFFLTHRIYVANRARQMLITYEGGPMFGLNPKGARRADGTALDLTDKAADPTDAEGFGRRGAVFASNNRFDQAIADFDKAVTLAPRESRYLRQRAMARLANRQPLLGLADLDKAIALDPADVEARLVRAGMKLGARDPAGAIEDLNALDKALPPPSDKRLQLAAMFDAAGDYAPAIANYDAWLKSHKEDSSRPSALNGRCWTRGQAGRELDLALDDCNAALRLQAGNASYLDSRALVRLRRGELPQALADYDAAIKGRPDSSWSLYGRSLVRRKLGDTAGAEADRTAALKIDPKLPEKGRKLGLEN
jgi:tetratricopeptide (TPR) repeat protein/predicted aspartyl protease